MKTARRTATTTGGRDATLRHILGDAALSVCMPPNPLAPVGWRWVALEEIARMESGHTPSRNHPEYWEGNIPWMGVRDAGKSHGSTITDTTEHTNELGISNSSARLLPKGTVCLSRGGTVGYVVMLGRAMATSQGFANWICGDELAPEFLKYLFLSEINALHRFSIGATIQTIYYPDLKAFHVCIPSRLEQQRIIGILDQAFEAIATAKANTEKNLQNARAIFESHLQSIFTQRGKGWVEKRLGDLSRINYGYTESASAKKVGPHFLRITDIQDNRVDWTTVPYCPIAANDMPKYKLADGDIVFARTGATTGKSYLVTKPPDAVFASYLIRVQLSDKELLPQFVNLFFQTHSYWDTIRAGVSGSTQGGFNATKLSELVIPFPKSPKEQNEVVASLNDVLAETEGLAKIYGRKLVALEALRRSLLHQAFVGNL